MVEISPLSCSAKIFGASVVIARFANGDVVTELALFVDGERYHYREFWLKVCRSNLVCTRLNPAATGAVQS